MIRSSRPTHDPNPFRKRPGISTLALLVTVTVLGLITAACSSGDGEGSMVRPVDEIVDGEIHVQDVGATSATVRVTTSVPVVCSVVYGTDDSYGEISTDLDMGGGAHSSHSAPLRGLEPDTEYHFRLQGTGSDGTIYRSEDMTFRTPPDSGEAADLRRNLASTQFGATIMSVSSAYGDSASWAAPNAIDGDPGTEWSSEGDGDAASITVQLAGESRITAVGLWSRTMETSAEIREFRVVTDQDEILGPFVLPDAAMLYAFDVDAVASWLRFEVVNSSGGNTGAVELAVYGEPLAE